MKIFRIMAVSLLLFLSGYSAIGQNKNYNFVLVHGAWHGAWEWFELEYLLVKSGNTVINIDLPGHGIDTTNPGNVTLNDYQTAIVRVLDQLDSPVILVGHCMGGVAISLAAEQRPAKVSKLVYLAAYLLQNNQPMLQVLSSDAKSMLPLAIILDTMNNIIDIKRSSIKDIFYSSSSDKYTMLAEKLLQPEPLLPAVTPIHISDAYKSVRRFYIETTYDMAISPTMQKRMYTALPCEEVFTLHAEHTPFFSTPDELKNILLKIAKDDTPTSIASSQSQLYIYPNPMNGILKIDHLCPTSKIYIWDVSGKLQYELKANSGSISVNFQNKPSGQYLIKIVSPGYTISKMITFQR